MKISRLLLLLLFFKDMIYCAGWTLVGDTFTEDRGLCEFDIWAQSSSPAQSLGFYADCVVGPSTSLQLASNVSTQSLNNQAFVEVEQSFYTTPDRRFNLGIIAGDGITTNKKNHANNSYIYIPLSFQWLDERLRTTFNIGWAGNDNFKKNLLTLSASASGNVAENIWIVGEVATNSDNSFSPYQSFYQVGASFLIHQKNVAIDISYLNSFRATGLGLFRLAIVFYGKFF
ncbi:hypothetical protein [Helicobacter mustelae]|uniref:Putative outer membrane protein n=1 Tax=Helicobacter mustelae (strain ATCC 43772 / CCUG 25715 / CIP 103759 / LMG 18044 / NCTC 12198 / R85-136P) TaxID=679897 RepID=D3UGG9_HELM1|nr:hypothetical protein [Helicobacter mustelae]CBG39590.1 Putative outer membrane protein [Helicobacter mustelae 12198]SQH71102.1 outer membrane protein [Helicobacter mustelae]STP12231.1 outer membrane protein [Helicobacter mustelae]